MKKAKFIRVTIEVIDEARLALLDFLTELSPSGIIEESDWEGIHGPACIYLSLDGSDEKLALLNRYLESLRELWGDKVVISCEIEKIIDPGWATEYQRYFTAQRITDRITVAPPWEEYAAGQREILIRIRPGPAFGTGTHETTRLCLSEIQEVSTRQRIDSMLDVGCGSAILSIAGAFLGIDRVTGVESDPQAVLSARDNVARNGLVDRVTIREELFGRATGTFDLVVANLTAGEIEPVIAPLFSSVAPGGHLILSGILDVEEEKMRRIIDGHRPSNCPESSVRRLGEWRCFVAARPRE
jgi:ribosomal protein L11 methyltransferase